ncbi:MAG: hypothetical protein ABSB49_08505 [Polyangia bacterium]|jgi:hypothetical protein
MRNRAPLLLGFCVLVACSNGGLDLPADAGSLGGVGGAGGALGPGSGGPGAGGSTGLFFNLPDGGVLGLLGNSGLAAVLGDGGLASLLGGNGLSSIFADGGLWESVADASADSAVGQLLCGPTVKSGATCSSSLPGCVLRSGGGACVCVGSAYFCPTDTTAGPQVCPAAVGSGTACASPLATCTGAGTVCMCGLGTYLCY